MHHYTLTSTLHFLTLALPTKIPLCECILNVCILSLQDKKKKKKSGQRKENENCGFENANTHLAPSLRLHRAVGKVVGMRKRNILYLVHLNIKKQYGLNIVKIRLKSGCRSQPALVHQRLKAALEDHQRNICTTSTPMLEGIVSCTHNQW